MNHPEPTPSRIAIVLGPGGASRYLLDCIKPLLDPGRNIELQGVFLEEAGVRHAAAMPFVKELCRVTFAVREFNGEEVERALLLRMRTARRALSLLAERGGVRHSFSSIKGPAIELLQRVAAEAEITVFEPVHPRTLSVLAGGARATSNRVAALLCHPSTSAAVLRAAARLAGDDARLISCILLPEPGVQLEELAEQVRAFGPGKVPRARCVEQQNASELALAVRETSASFLVAPAAGQMNGLPLLRFLREQVRCPVCLVRQWPGQ